MSVLSPAAALEQQQRQQGEQQQQQHALELPPKRLQLLRLPSLKAAAMRQELGATTLAAAPAARALSWRGFVFGWRLLGRELLLLPVLSPPAKNKESPLLLPQAAVFPSDAAAAAVSLKKDEVTQGPYELSVSSAYCSTCGRPEAQKWLRLWRALQRGFHPLMDPDSISSSSSIDTAAGAPPLLLQPLHLPLAEPTRCCSGTASSDAVPPIALLTALREMRETAVRMVLLLPASATAAASAAAADPKLVRQQQQQQQTLLWASQNPGSLVSVCKKALEGTRELQQPQQQEQRQLATAAVALHVPLQSLLPVLLEVIPHPLLLESLLWLIALLMPLAAAFPSCHMLLLQQSNGFSDCSNSRAGGCLCAAATSPLESLIDTVWGLILIWFERAPWLLLHALRLLKRKQSGSSIGGSRGMQQQQVFRLPKVCGGELLPWEMLG